MGTLELKLSLIQRLSLINDDDLLHRIKSLIDRMEERQAPSLLAGSKGCHKACARRYLGGAFY